MSADIAVVILTHNESLHIKRAIEAVRPFAKEVFLIDSYSTDGTVEIAQAAGATVLQNPWVNYSKQFAWGLENAPITATWVMRLDADEVVEPDLAREILDKLPHLPADVAGINLDRRHVFMGRWIKHGGRFPLTLLRIWRHGQGRIEDRWMDEHIVISGGRTVKFNGGFSDVNLKDITFFTTKHNAYATREALDILIRKYDLLAADEALSSESASFQAAVKRFVKERIYNRLPFWLSTMLYFQYRYFIQLGFLDGRPGLIYHFLQGYWYRFLVGVKTVEFERELAGLTTNEQRLARLSEVSGHKLLPSAAAAAATAQQTGS
jgi:glycosyltransferase involved in cell wall biosynthesis